MARRGAAGGYFGMVFANLPLATVRLAAGQEVQPMEEYRVGTMFVRISLDQIASLEEFQAITQTGELLSALGMIKGAA